jgi:putative PIN family toxin of toxin-antitoxin system
MPTGSKTKTKVVVDTNVFVSGLNFKGKPREVLNLIWKEEIEVYISPFIFKELEDTLEEDFDWSKKEIKDTIEEMKPKVIQVQPKVKVSVIKDKDDDNRILECAVEGKAQYIVSGDKHHVLPLTEFQGIKILSPAEFLRLI